MNEDYRTVISNSWEWRVRQAGLNSGATVKEFMAALPNSLLLGVELPKDIENFLACYTKANIAGREEELKEFTASVTAFLPDSFYEKRLIPDKERPTISDALWLAITAVARLELIANGDNNCFNLEELPLAA